MRIPAEGSWFLKLDQSAPVRYAVAVGVCLAAVLIRLGLDPLLGEHLPFPTLFPAVALAVCYGGIGPGLVTTILGFFAAQYLFIEPRFSLALETSREIVGAGAYGFACAIILLLGMGMRRARREADANTLLAQREQQRLERESFDRQRVEQALRDSQQRYRHLIEALPAAVYTCDAQGRVTLYNQAAVELWGRAPEIGKDLWCGSWKIYRPDGSDLPLDQCPMALTLREGRAIRGEEIVIERPDHTRRHVLANPEPIVDGSGVVIAAINMLIDVTEMKAAGDALRKSETRFRLLADTVPSIVWTAGPDGTITFASEQWYQYTGLTPEQNANGWTDLVLHPEDKKRCLEQWTAALRCGSEYEVEVRNRRHDGEYRWFVTRAVPVRDDSGRIAAWFGSTTDIHDYKIVQEALEEADRRKDDFLAMLGHELRNPLAPIRNAVQMLDHCDEESRQWAREIIDRQSRHLVRLVEDLLDVSRISRGKITLRQEWIDLRNALHQAVETCRPLIEGRGQRLEMSLPADELTLRADPARITQLVQNLLHNAAKFTPEGGHIWLNVDRDDGVAIVRVRDSGRGIAHDMLKRIFQPFTQVDGSLDRAQGGLGLGLALVRSLVEMHGGTVEAHSDGPGRGSEFVVRLPLTTAAEQRSDEPVDRQQSAAPVDGRIESSAPLNVLVVDDNRDSARSMAALLSVWGHRSRIAHDGQEALDAVRDFVPDAVLLDIGLPGMSGYEVARRLREMPEAQSAVLVAITGYGQEEDRRRSRESGFNHHLVKPVDPLCVERLLVEVAAEQNGRLAALGSGKD